MIKKILSQFIFLFIGLAICGSSFAYEYTHGKLRDLAQLMDTSLKAQRTEKNLKDLNIERILEIYNRFGRDEASADDLIELKFQVSHWKKYTTEVLIQQALLNQEEPMLFEILSYLKNINPKLSKDDLKALSLHPLIHRESLKDVYYSLVNQQSDPQKQIKIVPIKPSKWPYEKWVQYKEFSQYEFVGDGVRYRGITFQPGDIFLANLSHPGDGVYTVMCSPRSSFSHFAFFAILEENGLKFPAAIEIYELGVRAIPLSIFLSPQFTPYLEIYRFKSIPENWHALVNVKAKSMVREVHAYNFYYEKDNERELSCTTVGTCLYRRTGIRPIEDKSDFRGKIAENVLKLGAGGVKLLAPTDYMMSDRLQFIGVIDNDDFESEVTKELVLGRLRKLFETKTLDQTSFPLEYKINKWGVNQIRAGSFLGNLFMWIEGFSRETFPKGPTEGMAIVEIFESATHKGVVKSKDLIRNEIHSTLFSIHDLEERPELQSNIDQNIQHISRWLKD